MSVEFRQRTPGEYAQIVWKRKWLIILPAIAISAAITLVVWRLPNVYESTTLLIVKPSTISGVLVPTLSDVDLSMRINNIGQMVASRTSLEPLIIKYDLYRAERQRGEAMESLVERMRADIKVEVDKSRDDVTNAFRISYRERTPDNARNVTADLAGKYVTAQTKAITDASEQSRQFFEQQLAQAKEELDAVDQKRFQFMSENVRILPSTGPALIGQYTGLREQQKVLTSEIGRLRDSYTAINTQLVALQEQTDIDKLDVIEGRTDPKSTPAYGQLALRKATIEAELQNMKTTLKEKNPDVIAKQAELDSVKREMDQIVAEAEAKTQEVRKRIENRPDLRISGFKSDLQRISNEIARQEKLLDQTNAAITEIELRINSVPGAQVALEGLDREYQTKKLAYDQLLEKKKAAELAADVAANAQGETIQVIDPANTPQSPVAPKRAILMGMGLVLGLGVGFAFAAAFEVPRLLTIQTTDDAEHYTGLPVLISVPELLTPQEARRIPQRRLLLLAAGIVATIVSIPALAMALKMSHVFDRFAS